MQRKGFLRHNTPKISKWKRLPQRSLPYHFGRSILSLTSCSSAELVSVLDPLSKFQTGKLYLQPVKFPSQVQKELKINTELIDTDSLTELNKILAELNLPSH